jgi:Xaa-Pro aminopeptidase
MTTGLYLYAASQSNADIFASSGFLAPDAFDYLEVEGRRIVVVPQFEQAHAERVSGAEVWTLEELGLSEVLASGADRHTMTCELSLRALRRAAVDAVRVPEWLPVGLADHLRASGISVEVDPELLTARRRRKGATEVDAIRRAQDVTQRSFAMIRDTLATAQVGAGGRLELDGEPLTSERMHGVVRTFWAGEGCEGDTPIIAGGAQAADPHELGRGELRAGESIICDLFPRHAQARYFADMTRTFCVGEAPQELVELHAVVEQAVRESLAACGPGIPGAELNRRVSDLFFREGYHTLLHPAEEHGREQAAGYIHGLGHGVGLEVHETPSLGIAGRDPLEVGDVVTIEPGLYRAGFGGVRIEDLVVVTEDGCENLTDFPYGLGVR